MFSTSPSASPIVRDLFLAVRSGDRALVRELLASFDPSEDNDSLFCDDCYLIEYAIRHRRFGVARDCAEAGFVRLYAFHCNSEMIKILVEERQVDLLTALGVACAERGAALKASTVLHAVSEDLRFTELAEATVARCDPGDLQSAGTVLLCNAIRSNFDLAFVRMCVDKGAPVEDDSKSAALEALRCGRQDVFEYLIDECSSKLNTALALHIVCGGVRAQARTVCDRVALLRSVLARVAKPLHWEHVIFDMHDPLALLMGDDGGQSVERIEELLRAGHPAGQRELLDAIVRDHVLLVRLLLRSGGDELRELDRDLMAETAVAAAGADMARLLHEHGVRYDWRNTRDALPLHVAIDWGRPLPLIEYLVDILPPQLLTAKCQARGNDDKLHRGAYTFLHLACLRLANPRVVERLLELAVAQARRSGSSSNSSSRGDRIDWTQYESEYDGQMPLHALVFGVLLASDRTGDNAMTSSELKRTIDLLLKHGHPVNAVWRSPMYSAGTNTAPVAEEHRRPMTVLRYAETVRDNFVARDHDGVNDIVEMCKQLKRAAASHGASVKASR